MKIPDELSSILQSKPDVMHGQLCFVGTRVPLTVLLDNLAEGMGADEFLLEYPSVSRAQALSVIEWQDLGDDWAGFGKQSLT